MPPQAKISGTSEAIDRWVLSRLPWSWCSLPTVFVHMGVHGQTENQTTVTESLGRLVAAKKAGYKGNRVITMYKRIKES